MIFNNSVLVIFPQFYIKKSFVSHNIVKFISQNGKFPYLKWINILWFVTKLKSKCILYFFIILNIYRDNSFFVCDWPHSVLITVSARKWDNMTRWSEKKTGRASIWLLLLIFSLKLSFKCPLCLPHGSCLRICRIF